MVTLDWDTKGYYVCDYETHKALRGPMLQRDATAWINKQPERETYCVMSRYMLAKDGIYPKTNAGDAALRHDVIYNGYYPPHVYGEDGGYLEYLVRWENLFGEETVGKYHYWELGVKRPCTVKKLSLEDYNVHTYELDRANEAFERADRDQDQIAMDRALVSGLPHEIQLLV